MTKIDRVNTPIVKVEVGVMLMKNGKAWGNIFNDGKSSASGWVNKQYAPIHDPKYTTCPSDLTYKYSRYIDELNTGTLVPVKRITTTTLEMVID